MRVSVFAHAWAGALVLLAAALVEPAAGAQSTTASITGTVLTVDVARSNLTIKTSVGTSVKLAVGKSTSITRNGARSSLKGLALNDSVTAQYVVSTLAARVVTATGPAVSGASGKVRGLSLASGTLSVGSKQLQTNASTRISRNGQIVALRQITLRDSLVVHVAQGTTVALDVVASGPAESEVQGTIGGINGNSVTITPDDGSPAVTVVVGATTLIEVNDAPGTLADLQPGQVVEAEYDPTTFAAFSIDASSESEDAEVEGTVFAVDTTLGTVTITPQGGGANVTLTVNATTEIDVNDAGATLADIQTGMPIKAEYDTATMLAKEIEAGGSDGADGAGD